MARDGWAPLLDDLAVRHEAVLAMGGPDRMAQLAERGRLDVRSRIDLLVDPDSFVEFGALVGSIQRGALPPAPADAFVTGHATIEGRPVLVGAADPSVMGGSVGLGTLAKRRRLVALAELTGRPVVLLLDGPGSRTRHPNDSAPWTGDELRGLARLAGRVPVVAAILGPVAGHDALLAAAADHIVMTRRAAVFGAGPPLVHAATGVEVGAAELGGPSVHEGRLVDEVADDEPGALGAVRAYVVARTAVPDAVAPSQGATSVCAVLPADPTVTYDVDALLGAIADPGTWTRDVGPAAALVTGTTAVAGRNLVVVAGDPTHGDGRIDAPGARAAVERLRTAPDLPALMLIDSPGPAIGPEAEAAGTGRALAELLRSVATRSAPSIMVIVRRAHGDVPTILGLGPGSSVLTALALPGARLGPLPAETASEAAGRVADVAALVEHTEFGGAVDAAEQLVVDRVIDPDDLRPEIARAMRLLADVRG